MKYDDSTILKLSRKIAQFDIAFYDRPDFFDNIKQMNQYSKSILTCFNLVLDLLFALLSFALSVYLVVDLHPVIVVIILTSTIPNYFIKNRIKKEHHVSEKAIIPKQRFCEYLLSMMYNRSIKEEMQIYGFSEYIISKAENCQAEIREQKKKVSLKTAYKETLLLLLNRTSMLLQEVLIVLPDNYYGHQIVTYEDYDSGNCIIQKNYITQLLVHDVRTVNIEKINYQLFNGTVLSMTTSQILYGLEIIKAVSKKT